MTHRPAVFAALLGLTRAGSAIGDFWVQSDFCARVKGASDEHPVTFTDPVTEKKSTHGTADGRKACLHHVASIGVSALMRASVGQFDHAAGAGTDACRARHMSGTHGSVLP
ncbi:hypothetical protein OG749_02625 [Streptomyces nojiriensis]|uniref:hypothetical protein n=1 Tax=Streptomyces nojiriensis TaxID=66374 RepID=UPI002E17E70D